MVNEHRAEKNNEKKKKQAQAGGVPTLRHRILKAVKAPFHPPFCFPEEPATFLLLAGKNWNHEKIGTTETLLTNHAQKWNHSKEHPQIGGSATPNCN
jgi:hypothetical protein